MPECCWILTEAVLSLSDRRDSLEDGLEGDATGNLGVGDRDFVEGALKMGRAGVEDLDMVAFLAARGRGGESRGRKGGELVTGA